MVEDGETLPRSPFLSLPLSSGISEKQGRHQTHHTLRAHTACLVSTKAGLTKSSTCQTQALEALDGFYLGCLIPLLCPCTCCHSAWNPLSPLAHLQISPHPLSPNSNVICSVKPSTKCTEVLPIVLLRTLCRFQYYFAHPMIMQHIHVFLSMRALSPLRKRNISLICYFQCLTYCLASSRHPIKSCKSIAMFYSSLLSLSELL